jgi:23S rRNA pseudouridine2605 synthase
MAGERLSKFLARSGVASRRKAEHIIRSGKVSVNGTIVIDPYYEVSSPSDRVIVDGKILTPVTRFYYIALYKPVGYLSDLADPRSRRLARSLIPLEDTLFPVGRLDYNSEGLMIFTNDGAFANRIMHPRYETEKEYLVKVSGKLDRNDIRRMTQGLRFQGQTYKAKSITTVRETTQNAWYTFIVTEGRNRMIRKLAEAVGHPVLKLKRVRIGDIRLGHLKPGEYRFIDKRLLKAHLPSSGAF